MGGRVALELGLSSPDRVGRLVLLMPAPAFIRYREFVRIARVLRPELALLPVPVSHRQVVRSIRRMFARPSRLPGAWYDAAADEFLRVFSTPRGRIAFFSAARQIYLEEPYGERGFWDRLPSLSRPALFVWGARDRLAPAVFARASRLYSGMKLADRHRPIHNLVISNVPGPAFPLYLAGARLAMLCPLGPVMEGAGLNITVLSYMDSVDVGLIACRELMPDLWDLANDFVDSMDELEKAAAAQSGETRPAAAAQP